MNPATFNYAQEVLKSMDEQNRRLMSNPFDRVAANRFSDFYNELPQEFKPYDSSNEHKISY